MVDSHKGYRKTTSIILIVLSSLILIAGLQNMFLLLIGAAGIAAGVLELNANKNKQFYLISGIILFIAAVFNIVIIKDISLFAIYSIVIGIFNVIYSREK